MISSGAVAMVYKDFEYHVAQTVHGWKWTVFVGATTMRTGLSLTRVAAVLRAEHTIDKLQTISDDRSFAKDTRHSNLEI
jgi:hypothetical protein